MENPGSGYNIVFSLLKFLKSVIPHPLPSLKTIKKNGIKNELSFFFFISNSLIYLKNYVSTYS
jgi:hypothetical protein